MTRIFQHLQIRSDSSALSEKACAFLRLLFCIAFVFNSLIAGLHFHISGEHSQISGPEHESECVLCELGLSSNNDLVSTSVETDVIEITAFLVSEDYKSTYAISRNLPFSPRAPPLS